MTSGAAAEQAIDFARSSCAWLLRDQDGWGRFSIDAVLTVGASERYVLTAQVFAGNVYAGEGLFKDPPYGFSAAFSATHFRIFRDPVRDGNGASDTLGPHADLFREIRIHLQETSCSSISVGELFAAGGDLRIPLVARIAMAPQAGRSSCTLEFPVRHINIDTAARRFQAETGPLLVLEDGAGDDLSRLRRAYVMFGRTDRAEFLLDAPRHAGPSGGWARTAAGACTVTLLRTES